jgi:RND family efflux transporter MFP subunit
LRLLPFLLMALTAGCSKETGDPPVKGEAAQAGQPAQHTVTVTNPKRQTVRYTIGQPGHIEAFERTAMYAKIAGYVEKIHVDIGDPVEGPLYDEKGKKVRPGTLLAELWVPELVAELNQKQALADQAAEEIALAKELVAVAEASLRSIEAQMKEAEAGRTRAQATYERWKLEYERVDANVRRGVLDAQTRDETLRQLESARAGKDEIEAKVESAKVAVKESEAKVRKARADVKVAAARHVAAEADRDHVAALVQYTKLEAPYKGVVVWRNVNTGDFFQPAAGAGSKGEPLFIVAQEDPVRIFVDVPETDAVLVTKDAEARIRVRGLSNEEFGGKVKRSSWALDPKARTLRTEIDVDNPGARLRPGMYAYATITVVHANTWTLPAKAVVAKDEQTFCFRVENDKAIRTPVKIGIREGQVIEVLKKQTKPPKPGEAGTWEDFTDEDKIATSNAETLTDGQAVSVAPDKE